MKLEHLIQAYRVNGIEAEIKEEGVINFTNGISASYLLDDEEIVITMKIFVNGLGGIKVNEQVLYTIKLIKIFQSTMILLGNMTQIESNMVLDKLGVFDGTFKEGKQIKHLEHQYRIEVIAGLMCLSISEENINIK